MATTTQCGSYNFEWGENITEMHDSTPFLLHNDLPSLRSKLKKEGYILLRNQIDTQLIDNALRVVATTLDRSWHCIEHKADERDVTDLYIKENSRGILLTGYKPITHNDAVLSLLHNDALVHLMNGIFDAEAVTYDTKWLRVKGRNEYTDEHSDFYRFAENCRQMVTVWMPLMDIPKSKGPLAVCPRSHLLTYKKSFYYDYDLEDKTDAELPEEFASFNQTAKWQTTDFKKGDLLIFDIRTVHASLVNKTDRYRISIDTRWQPRQSVSVWGESFIRFKQNEEKRIRQGHGEEESALESMMMDCAVSENESDNDVIADLDFVEVSHRMGKRTSVLQSHGAHASLSGFV